MEAAARSAPRMLPLPQSPGWAGSVSRHRERRNAWPRESRRAACSVREDVDRGRDRSALADRADTHRSRSDFVLAAGLALGQLERFRTRLSFGISQDQLDFLLH